MSLPTVPVTMVRVGAGPYPAFALPAGFSVAWYEPGCEDWWYDIQRVSDRFNVITRETFSRYFGDRPAELPARQCYLLDAAGTPVGTATAWLDNGYRGQLWGRLHWVAVRPAWQGRGLGRPLLSVVCERLGRLHPERVYLRTAPQRLPAIHLYSLFGFVPDLQSPEDARAWAWISQQLRTRPAATGS